jgi:hypothetical protein
MVLHRPSEPAPFHGNSASLPNGHLSEKLTTIRSTRLPPRNAPNSIHRH